jgi:two-component system, OmpR family, sensor histidine kinase SenX3
MRRDSRAPMFAIAGGLLGLVLLLATLQYRWLGQVSGAERDRMTANLNRRAAAFGEDFDQEVTRAYLLFQLDPMQHDQSAAASMGTRYDRWQATARYPRMIKDVYLVPSTAAVNESGLLQRFNPSTRFLEPADWPAAMSEIRAQLSQAAPASRERPSPTGAFMMRTMAATVWPTVPALVIPTPLVMLSHLSAVAAGALSSLNMAPEVRYTVVLFDADYIKGEMLPALARQHFQGTGDGFDYQLAVVPTAASGLVYHSVPEFAPTAESPVDAKVELFQVRVKDFEPLVNEVSRFATFTAMPPPGAGRTNQTFIRQTIAPTVSIRNAPMSIVVERGSPAMVQQRADRLITGAVTYSAGAARAAVPPPHWRLLVKHPSGSLEQAVNAVRRRNLAVSTGILGVLGVSVGFLVLSTRRAQELARRQLEFVATVSHELRTPLAVIRSAADNLADGVINDEARVRQYGLLVRQEGMRLTDLVEQILEFAGLQSGQRTMAARPVPIAAVLRDVVSAAEPIAQSASIAIELDIADNLPAVDGDEAALRRVFQNLLGNAVKYGAAARASAASEPRERNGAFGAPVSERVGGSGAAKPPGRRGWVGVGAVLAAGRVEVSFSDRGIGIAVSEQEKIFDPFYRTPEVVAAQIQGAGLGLSLVKRIVEAHAGRVTLASAPGEGSTFTVSLPVSKGDAAESHDGVTHAAATQPS